MPGIRITAEASHLTEKALDFYGFNGYESFYNADYEDNESDEYISCMYYKTERKLTRFKADFHGKITGPEFRWFAGIAVDYGRALNPDDGASGLYIGLNFLY